MESINQNIANNLKKMRKDKGLTLEELSEISNVSKSMLSEIERGGTNPTILVLWKIADGLKIPLTLLISKENPDFTIMRQDQQELINQDSTYRIHSIFPYYEPHKTEVMQIEIFPHGNLFNSGHRMGVDETAIILRGEITLKLDNESIDLQSGDAIRFKGGTSHEYINRSNQPVNILNILTYT